MGGYFSAEGYIMLDNENFLLLLLHFCNIYISSKPAIESEPLCLLGSRVALFSGFHLINSGSQSHLQGNVYAHARSFKLYKARRK